MQKKEGINRAILVKFVSYKNKQEVMSKRKALKNTKLIISEDLTRARAMQFRIAREKYGNRNAWTLDGKLFAIVDNVKTIIVN